MELEILKKKVSTFRGEGGRVHGVSDEVLIELLNAWEQWVGPSSGFAQAIGLNRNSIPKLIGKAKRLKREGFPTGDFKEIKVEGSGGVPAGLSSVPCVGIELGLTDGRVIRFPQVDQLLEFMKKAA